MTRLATTLASLSAALLATGLALQAEAQFEKPGVYAQYQACLSSIGKSGFEGDLLRCYEMCLALPHPDNCGDERCLYERRKARALGETMALGMGAFNEPSSAALMGIATLRKRMTDCETAWSIAKAEEIEALKGIEPGEIVGLINDALQQDERDAQLATKAHCVRALAAISTAKVRRPDPADITFGGIPRSADWILEACAEHVGAAGLAPQDVVPPGTIVVDGRGIAKATEGIHVIHATYGGNCASQGFGVERGNATAHVRAACEGQASCAYTVDYQVLGDVAPNCAKDFVVRYACMETPDPNAGCKQYRDLVSNGAGGGQYAGVPIGDLGPGRELRITRKSGAIRRVTLHARTSGGSWRVVYSGTRTVFTANDAVVGACRKHKCTHFSVQINGEHERYDKVAGRAAISACPAGRAMSPVTLGTPEPVAGPTQTVSLAPEAGYRKVARLQCQ